MPGDSLAVLHEALRPYVAQQSYHQPGGLTRFAREQLGVHFWRGQRQAARLIESATPIVAVKTGHGVGKTLLGSVTICWWLVTGGPGTVVVTSAPTNRQVEELLWREVNTLWLRSPLLRSLGSPLQREVKLGPDWVAYGFSTNEPQRFQGWHAPRLRFLIDEANAFPEHLWAVIDSCMTGGDQKLVMFGNPIVSVGRFFRTFGDPKASSLTIGAREHPNVRAGRELIPGSVTAEWIESFEHRYSNQPDMIGSRIDGLFPSGGGSRGIVPLDWLRAARNVKAATLRPVALGVDVARYGENFTVLTRLAGQRIERQQVWSRQSTTRTAEMIAVAYADMQADAIVVDDPGVGGGVTDILRDRGLPVVAFNGGEKALEPARFVNRNAEAWWALREGFENGLFELQLAESEMDMQLAARKHFIRADRRIELESKTDFAKRTGMPSPDHADSLAMAAWWVMSQWRELAGA